MKCRDCGKQGCKQTPFGVCGRCEHILEMKRKETRRGCQERAKEARRQKRAEKRAQKDTTSPF